MGSRSRGSRKKSKGLGCTGSTGRLGLFMENILEAAWTQSTVRRWRSWRWKLWRWKTRRWKTGRWKTRRWRSRKGWW